MAFSIYIKSHIVTLFDLIFRSLCTTKSIADTDRQKGNRGSLEIARRHPHLASAANTTLRSIKPDLNKGLPRLDGYHHVAYRAASISITTTAAILKPDEVLVSTSL